MRLYQQLSLLFVLATVLFSACTPYVVRPAFYYWDDHWELPDLTRQYLDTLGSDRIYVRFFDVEWDAQRNRALPIRSIHLAPTFPAGLELVPVVYLSEHILPEIRPEARQQLAALIFERVIRIADSLPFHSVQLDCNWSVATKDAYFGLLEHLQQQLHAVGADLTVSVYPHHIVGRDSLGVPPTQQAMFMLYEIADMDRISQDNTLCSTDQLRAAVVAAENYPLVLDLVLPIFSWGLVVRNQETVALMRHLHLSELEDRDRFEVVNAYFYRVLENTYLDGVFLYKNDLIRVESVNPDQLKKTLKPLSPYLRRDQLEVGFYHYDLNTLSQYAVGEIEALLELFE